MELDEILEKFRKDCPSKCEPDCEHCRVFKRLTHTDIFNWHKEQCKNCKEEKLNMVAKYFKNKLKLDDRKDDEV